MFDDTRFLVVRSACQLIDEWLGSYLLPWLAFAGGLAAFGLLFWTLYDAIHRNQQEGMDNDVLDSGRGRPRSPGGDRVHSGNDLHDAVFSVVGSGKWRTGTPADLDQIITRYAARQTAETSRETDRR